MTLHLIADAFFTETYKALDFVHIPDPEAGKEHTEDDPCSLRRRAQYLRDHVRTKCYHVH